MSEKILIVDDDIDSLKLIGLMLQRHGYEVVAASAGVQALSKAMADRPDLIILDIMMPDMDGYEVCRRLRANPETRPIPIIMFTAKTLVDDKVAGFEAGADDYLTKPTHPAELASRVKAILARSANQRRRDTKKGMTIGLLGAKGGLGTTTLALNIGAALVAAGENPIVADFRLGRGSMGLAIGFERSYGMANTLARPTADIRPAAVERELVVHSSGLRALLSSPRPKEAQMKYPIESVVAVIGSLRTMGRPAIFDLGCGFDDSISRLQREMDQLILVVEPAGITLAMARELLQELETSGAGSGRIHIVVINRSQSSLQTPWNEVEQMVGRELRAIVSAAPELAFQAARAATPIVLLQPSSIVANQIIKLSEELNQRIRTLASGGLIT
ncbi:MAG: transcriptional regulator [Chloroflexota bacterium]|nr:MAG: transcriptional regulator [Chloroflexota bacterium]